MLQFSQPFDTDWGKMFRQKAVDLIVSGEIHDHIKFSGWNERDYERRRNDTDLTKALSFVKLRTEEATSMTKERVAKLFVDLLWMHYGQIHSFNATLRDPKPTHKEELQEFINFVYLHTNLF